MTDNKDPNHKKSISGFVHGLDKSAIFTVIGIVILFSTAIVVTLIAPSYVDPTWTSPSSSYQVQMHEISDPNYYISSSATGSATLQAVYHLKANFTLLAFQESDTVKIIAPEKLQKYVTKSGEIPLKLTSELLLLRKPLKSDDFDAPAFAEKLNATLQESWEKDHPPPKEKTDKAPAKPRFEILELYQPQGSEAFAVSSPDIIVENWVDTNFKILDAAPQHDYHQSPGVIYVSNPQEYRISRYVFNDQEGWRYDPEGKPVANLQQLQKNEMGFRSRAELIALGEHIYAIEGCWYCHTDQTRTLVQDVVLNGSDSYPAPPSCANEYIYQQITFPGTRRIGPDISRVGIKRPSRDWHKGHFWSPKTASQGSIMPAFRHFFDNDPRGTSKNTIGIPNYRFEAIYQYLMTKGTRITPPSQAWWLGKDPIQTKEIIEGSRTLPK